MTENPEDYQPPEPSTGWKDVLIRDRWRLIGVGLIAAAVAMYFGYSPEIPREARLFGIALLIGSFIGWPVASRLVSWLFSPSYYYVQSVDSEQNVQSVWQLPPDVWADMTVENSTSLHQWKASVPLYEVQSYDPEENHAVGTWRASATDLELIESENSIADVRGRLEEMARLAIVYRTKVTSIARDATVAAVADVLEDLEASAAVMPAEDVVSDAVRANTPDDLKNALSPASEEKKDVVDDLDQEAVDVDQEADDLDAADAADLDAAEVASNGGADGE